MSEQAALRCEGLVKRFGELVAVDGVSLSIARGECLGLLGPNGAGKTTTVEMLEGLTKPDRGHIEILGVPVLDDRAFRRVRPRIGVQLQQTELSDRLTVRETMRLFRSFYPQGRDVEELLDLLALREKQAARVMTLSGGPKQRLALACALAGAPDVLFLDEPTTGLDPQARLKVSEVVEQFRAQGGSVLVTTHYMEEAARLCGRVAIMDQGRVIAVDSPQALIASLGAEQIIELELSDDRAQADYLDTLPGVMKLRRRGRAYAIATTSLSDTLPALVREVERHEQRLETITTHEATLEDVFVALTGKALRDG